MPCCPNPAGPGHRPAWRAGGAAAALLALALGAGVADPAHAALPLDKLRLPTGFRIELVTDAVPNARQMALGRSADGKSMVYVGSRSAGKVYAFQIEGGRAGPVRTVASGLEMPSGVAWRDGSLYVAAVSKILRFDGIDDRLAQPPAPVVVTDKLPGERHHGWKFIAFGPDGALYVPVGAPCNVCEPSERHAVIQRMKPDGSGLETVARGVRNSVGFDWSPVDKTLWFTENGRDMLGDDLPADELNRVTQTGQHFGFPYCHQGNTADPEYGARRPCSEFVAPAAHARRARRRDRHALLHRHAVSGGLPRQRLHRRARLVEPQQQGRLPGRPRDGRRPGHAPAGPRPSSTAGCRANRAWGRPADVLVLPDGSLLVSDDLAGAIYRIRYAS